jgi:hypothetical protein
MFNIERERKEGNNTEKKFYRRKFIEFLILLDFVIVFLIILFSINYIYFEAIQEEKLTTIITLTSSKETSLVSVIFQNTTLTYTSKIETTPTIVETTTPTTIITETTLEETTTPTVITYTKRTKTTIGATTLTTTTQTTTTAITSVTTTTTTAYAYFIWNDGGDLEEAKRMGFVSNVVYSPDKSNVSITMNGIPEVGLIIDNILHLEKQYGGDYAKVYILKRLEHPENFSIFLIQFYAGNSWENGVHILTIDLKNPLDSYTLNFMGYNLLKMRIEIILNSDFNTNFQDTISLGFGSGE